MSLLSNQSLRGHYQGEYTKVYSILSLRPFVCFFHRKKQTKARPIEYFVFSMEKTKGPDKSISAMIRLTHGIAIIIHKLYITLGFTVLSRFLNNNRLLLRQRRTALPPSLLHGCIRSETFLYSLNNIWGP